MQFSSDSTYVVIPYNSTLNTIATGTGEFTFSFWAKNISGDYANFIKGPGNFDFLNGCLRGWSPTQWGCDYPSNISAPNWTNIVLTNKPTVTLMLYINGIGQTVGPPLGPPNTILSASNGLVIGGWGQNAALSGSIDDLRVYNRVFTPDDVSKLYNNGNGCIP